MLDQLMSLMENLAKELKEAEPDKREHFIRSTLILLDVATESLEISPEFRQKFATVHSVFLKYPECRDTLIQGLKAYDLFVQTSSK